VQEGLEVVDSVRMLGSGVDSEEEERGLIPAGVGGIDGGLGIGVEDWDGSGAFGEKWGESRFE